MKLPSPYLQSDVYGRRSRLSSSWYLEHIGSSKTLYMGETPYLLGINYGFSYCCYQVPMKSRFFLLLTQLDLGAHCHFFKSDLQHEGLIWTLVRSNQAKYDFFCHFLIGLKTFDWDCISDQSNHKVFSPPSADWEINIFPWKPVAVRWLTLNQSGNTQFSLMSGDGWPFSRAYDWELSHRIVTHPKLQTS